MQARESGRLANSTRGLFIYTFKVTGGSRGVDEKDLPANEWHCFHPGRTIGQREGSERLKQHAGWTGGQLRHVICLSLNDAKKVSA